MPVFKKIKPVCVRLSRVDVSSHTVSNLLKTNPLLVHGSLKSSSSSSPIEIAKETVHSASPDELYNKAMKHVVTLYRDNCQPKKIERSIQRSPFTDISTNNPGCHHPTEQPTINVIPDLTDLNAPIETIKRTLENVMRTNESSIGIVLQSLSKFLLLYNERLHLEKARGSHTDSELYETKHLLNQAKHTNTKLVTDVQELELQKSKLTIQNEKLTETVVKLATELNTKSKMFDEERKKNSKLSEDYVLVLVRLTSNSHK